MDLAQLMQTFADSPVTILTVLLWAAAVLAVAVLLLWVLAAAYMFRECRCLAEPRKKAAEDSQPPPEVHRRLPSEEVILSATALRAAGPQ